MALEMYRYLFHVRFVYDLFTIRLKVYKYGYNNKKKKLGIVKLLQSFVIERLVF